MKISWIEEHRKNIVVDTCWWRFNSAAEIRIYFTGFDAFKMANNLFSIWCNIVEVSWSFYNAFCKCKTNNLYEALLINVVLFGNEDDEGGGGGGGNDDDEGDNDDDDDDDDDDEITTTDNDIWWRQW